MDALFKVVFLLVFSGILAYVGDFLGARIGKSRLRVFNMRPKNTATFITVVTGMLITSVSLLFILNISSEARDGLLHIKKIREDLASAEKKLQEYQEEIKKTRKIIENDEQKIFSLSESNLALARERTTLISSIASFTREQEVQRASLEELQRKKMALEKDVSRLSAQVAQKNQQEIIFNKNEHLALGVIPAKMSSETLKIRLISLIHSAIEQARERGSSVPSIQEFWEKNGRELNTTLSTLQKMSDQELVVVVSSGQNVVRGEQLEGVKFRFRPNSIIFKKGDEIGRMVLDSGPDRVEIARTLQDFLSNEVNVIAVNKGMLFDPMTRQIGSMDIEGLLNLSDLSQQITRAGGTVEIILQAKADIPVAGPLSFNVQIQPYAR